MGMFQKRYQRQICYRNALRRGSPPSLSHTTSGGLLWQCFECLMTMSFIPILLLQGLKPHTQKTCVWSPNAVPCSYFHNPWRLQMRGRSSKLCSTPWKLWRLGTHCWISQLLRVRRNHLNWLILRNTQSQNQNHLHLTWQTIHSQIKKASAPEKHLISTERRHGRRT